MYATILVYFVVVNLLFINLYKKSETWYEIKVLFLSCMVISVAVPFWIYWAKISPEIVQSSMLQGNGWMLFA